MSSFTNFNENIVKASYLASLIIAKNGKPHTIGETLVLPAAKEIVRCVLGDKAAKEIEKVSLSNDTVKRRIDDMSSNIKNKLLLYLKDCNFFALQIDESTDITNMAQLMVFIRFDRNDEIIEEFLFCKPLQTHRTSEIIFTTINEYLIEINLPWSKCVGFCSDGARAMTGRLSGVATRIKKVASLCKTMHCMIHRQALASKNMPKSLKLVLDSAVKIVNLIKARPLNSRLFTVLCNEMGSTHKSLLLHIEVRWLSRGKVLTRLFELRSEILLLLTDIDEEKSKLFCDDEWLSRLAYMADIFDRLNILNLSLQGSNINMFYASDKVNAFVRKLDLFISQVSKNDLSAFETLNTFWKNNEIQPNSNIITDISEHLQLLKSNILQYFPENNSEMKLIINPFEDDYIKNIPEGILAKELFIDLTSDSTLKTAFKTKNITNFWLDVKQEYSALSTQALQFLIPFVSTYLCENTFSHLLYTKNKYRSRLNVENNLRLQVSNLEPDIDVIESFERQRCSLNTIIYGVPESSSASAAQRISDDCSSIRSLLEPHSLVIPDNSKVIRLGKVVAGKSRPIKLLCGSSESSSKLVSDFRDLVKNGIQFPTGFRIVSDKTLMQRTLLRSCYAELENCKLNGETNLEISYVNGAPQVRIAKSKNTGFLHHAITESLDSLVPPDPYHPPLTINFYNNIHVPGLNSTHSFFDFDNADYINIHNFISNFDWPSTLSALSVDSAFNTFYDAFHQSVLRFVPKRHFKHFSLLRAHYKYLSKKLYREFVDRTELSINANPSNFWKFIKKQRFNSDIPKTLTLNGASSSNEQDAADMFAIYFKSVYSCEVVNDDVSDLKILSFDLPNNAYFTVDDVFHSLSTLSGAKNVGPDGLPGVFLLQLRSIIAYPYANLTPVHKSGVKSDISNYRPISIQSHLSKLFESLVLNSIKPSVNNILIEEQHGFRPGRSTTTCNLVFSNFVFDSFKKRSQVDVVYTDLAKAFDTVNHSVLLRVLETSGFGEPVLSWFGSFLVNRLQWVKLFGIKSNIFSSTSGVPQDDMKLFMEINSAADCENLQSSLDCFVSWCLKIGLKVNASKCRVMTFTRSRSTILFDYNISGLTIERVDNLIDLGFKLSSTLSPSPHFAMITSRAFKVLGFIMRLSKDFKLSKSLKSLYCALVRPILEYGSVVWDPYTVSDINQLERVQLRFLRFCCFVLGIPHLAHD
ncbi:hypothetical protein QTP88_029444 [Uroleucon formosanum]